MITEGFIGQLDVGKRQREIIPALLGNSLFRDEELHVPLQLHFNEKMPIVVSFYEYYRFLDTFVSTVLAEGIAKVILVRIKMPAVIPLPPSLLDARVAIFHDLEVESAELSARGTDHLCVDANFKLYSWSAGDNRFAIRWVSPSGNRLGAEALEKLRALVGLLPATFDYVGDLQVGGSERC